MERVDVWLEWAGGTLSAGTKEENPRSWISQLWPHKLTQTAALNCRQGIHPIISSLKGGGVLKPKDKDNDNVDENDDVDELADLDDAVGDADGDEVPGPAGPEEEAVGGGHPHPQVDRVGAAHQAGGPVQGAALHYALSTMVLGAALHCPYFCCISGLLKKR